MSRIGDDKRMDGARALGMRGGSSAAAPQQEGHESTLDSADDAPISSVPSSQRHTTLKGVHATPVRLAREGAKSGVARPPSGITKRPLPVPAYPPNSLFEGS